MYHATRDTICTDWSRPSYVDAYLTKMGQSKSCGGLKTRRLPVNTAHQTTRYATDVHLLPGLANRILADELQQPRMVPG